MVDNLFQITQAFKASDILMTDCKGHFDCNEVQDYCKSTGNMLHIVVVYAPRGFKQDTP